MRTGIGPPFLLKIYYSDHCLHDSRLYIQKILAKREMINCERKIVFAILTINSVTTAVRELNGTIKNILCDHCLHDSGLYIQKISTKRKMINCQKFNFLLFLTIKSVTIGVRELNGISQISLVTHDAKGEMREI